MANATVLKEFLNIQHPAMVGLGWDQGKKEVDLDLQCVVINDLGEVIEAIYYNVPESNISKIQYSGDSKGNGTGLDEVVTIDLRTLPQSAKYIAFLSCCSSGKPANLNENTLITVQQLNKTLFKSSLKEQGKNLAFLPTIFSKDFSGQWFSNSVKQVGNGKNFMECQELIKKGLVLAGFDPNLSHQCKSWTGDKSFRLDKENPLILPQAMQKILVGLGWKTKCDIDCSVLTYDASNKQVDQVYFGNKSSKDGAIIHKGDNLTGEGDDKQGDDEIIEVNLGQVSPKIQTIWTVITVYTDNKQFDDVRSAYCRLMESASGKEFCRFQLSKNKDGVSNGSIMSCLTRYGENTWAIVGKGFYTQGTRSASIVAPIIERILHNDYSKVKFSDADKSGNPSWQLSVMRAENLGSFDVGGKSDPYVKIKLNGKKIGRTNTVMLDLNPTYNYPMQVNLSVGDKVVFKILDYDRFTADDYMGSCFFEVQQSHFDEPVKEYELKVKNKEGKDQNTYKGSLFIQLKEL